MSIDFIHGMTFLMKYWYLYFLGDDDELPKVYYGGQNASEMSSDFFFYFIFGDLIQLISFPLAVFYVFPLAIFEALMLQSRHLLF